MATSDELEELFITFTPRISARGQAAARDLTDTLDEITEKGDKAKATMGTGLAGALDNVAQAAGGSDGSLSDLDSTLAEIEQTLSGLDQPTKNFTSELMTMAAGGLLITGVTLGIELLISKFVELQEEVEEAADKADEAGRRLQAALDDRARAEDPVGFARKELDDEVAKQLELIKSIQEIEGRAQLGVLSVWDEKKLDKAKEQLREVTTNVQLYRIALKDATDAARDEAAPFGPKDFGGPGSVDTFVKGFDQRAEAIKRFKDQLLDLGDNATASQVDNLERALARLVDQADRLGVDASAQIAALRSQIEGLKLFEDLGGGFDQISSFEELERVWTEISKLKNEGKNVTLLENEAMRTQLRLAKEQAKAQGEHLNGAELVKQHTEEATEETRQQVEHYRDQARAVENVTRGAIGLAQALGIVDDESASILQNIATIGGNLTGALAGDLTSIVSVVGGVLGALSGILGSGESPAARNAREAVQRNTEALRTLTKNLTSLGLGLSTDELDRARRVTDQALERLRGNSRDPSQLFPGAVRDAAEEFGLTMERLAEIARDLHIEFVPTIEGLEQFRDLLSEPLGPGFSRGFADRMQGLNLSFEVNDIVDPLEQLVQIQRVVNSKLDFGALEGLGGFDLSTPEGRQAAQQFIAGITEQLLAGISPDTGSLTGQEFRDLLRDFEARLDQTEQQFGGETQQFGLKETMTVAQGSEILSYLSSALVYAQETALNTRRIKELLENAAAGGPFTPPPDSGVAAPTPAAIQERALARGNPTVS